MKRIFVIWVCAIVVLSVILTGCSKNTVESNKTGQNNEGQTQSNLSSKEDDSIVTEPGVFPIVKDGEKATISMTVSTNAVVDDFDNNEFTKWFEEKTGVDFEFTVLPSSDARQKLSLMMSSGDYTDVIAGFNLSLAEQQLYASQGILIPLDDLIEKYGVETKKAFEEFSEYNIKQIYSLLDGKIYSLPNLVECYHCRVKAKMWIYQPWLQNLGLQMPTTTEEFYQVLKAFKEQDPNGNGKDDEIPLAGSPKGWMTQIDTFLMNAFIRNDGDKRLVVKDGKIDVTYNKPEWKKGLEYMKKLYDEGLIAPESFTQDADQLKLLVENAEIPILGAVPGGVVPAQIMGESGRWLEYKTVPALKGPDGVQEVALFRGVGNESRFYITNKCKYPEVAFRVGDALYNDEIFARAQFGRPGKEWRWAEEGEKGIDGNQGVFRQLISVQEMDKNITWYQQIPEKQPLKFRLGRVIDNPLEKILYEESRDKYYPYADDINTTVPNLIFSEEQAAELVDIETSLVEYVTEMTVRFITGDVDIETGWENYLKELEKMNIKRYLEIYQKSYDDKYKN